MKEETLVKKLKEFFSQMLPPPSVLGKVVKVYESAGKAHFLNSVYSADVQLLELDENGNFKDSGIIVPDVPILSIGVGNRRGIFFLPEEGSIVKVSFLYRSWDYPVIDGVLSLNREIPQHPKTKAVIYIDEIYIRGNLRVSGEIWDYEGTKGSLNDLRQTYNSHTHTGDSGGTTSDPNQKVGV